jgi:hypothetical protein
MAIVLGILLGAICGVVATAAKQRWFEQLLVPSKVLLGVLVAFTALQLFQARNTDAVAAATLFVVALVTAFALVAGAFSLGLVLHKVDQRGSRKHALLLLTDFFLLITVSYAASELVLRPMARAEVKSHESRIASQKREIEKLSNEIPQPYRSMGPQMVRGLAADNLSRAKQGLPVIPLPENVTEKFERLSQLQSQLPPRGTEYILAARNNDDRKTQFSFALVAGWLVACVGGPVWLMNRKK